MKILYKQVYYEKQTQKLFYFISDFLYQLNNLKKHTFKTADIK